MCARSDALDAGSGHHRDTGEPDDKQWSKPSTWLRWLSSAAPRWNRMISVPAGYVEFQGQQQTVAAWLECGVSG